MSDRVKLLVFGGTNLTQKSLSPAGFGMQQPKCLKLWWTTSPFEEVLKVTNPGIKRDQVVERCLQSKLNLKLQPVFLSH